MNTLLVLKPEVGFPLTIQAEAIELKNTAVTVLTGITAIGNAEALAIAAEAMANAAGVVKRMESARVAVKAPVLDAGTRIDKMAKEYSAPIQVELDRVKKLVSDFHTKEAARVAEENRRREEEERHRAEEAERIRREEAAKAERERLAKEEEIRRAAEAEQARLQEEARQAELARQAADQTAADEQDDGLSGLRQASADEAREEEERIQAQQQAAREEEARKLAEAQEEERRVLAQQEADRVSEQSRLAMTRPSAPAKVSGVSSRAVWKFEVTNPSEVFKAHPELCRLEILPASVNTAIRNGMRDCPGLKIYQSTETSVRAR